MEKPKSTVSEIIDEIIPEPTGGAHRDKNLILQNIRFSISKNLEYFKDMTAEEIFNDRKNKYLKIGRNKGFIDNRNELSSLKEKENKIFQNFKNKKFLLVVAVTLIALISIIAL